MKSFTLPQLINLIEEHKMTNYKSSVSIISECTTQDALQSAAIAIKAGYNHHLLTEREFMALDLKCCDKLDQIKEKQGAL